MEQRTVSVKPAEWLKRATVYSPARHPSPVDLRLDANEGPLPEAWLAAEMAALARECLRSYPSAKALEATLANRWGVTPEQVLVTAGADDALERALNCVLQPDRELILPVPTFEMIERYALRTQCTVRQVPWTQGALPVPEMRACITERTGAIVVVTPNSPTGLVATAQDLALLSQAAPHALLMVDLAYAEFADQELMGDVLALPNALAFRTFSKACGLAGLRVGYVVGSSEIIGWLRAAGHPYAVSGPSLAMAEVLHHRGQEALARTVFEVKRERHDLTAALAACGISVSESQANFVLAHFADARWVCDALAGLGISVRSFGANPLLENRLRITLPGVDGDYERLKGALLSALRPQALLLDMDDTLIDTVPSYRQAIVETVRALGGHTDLAGVAAEKSLPGANNDWVCSHRILQKQGIDVPLETVTRVFEEFYQGSLAHPPLKRLETLRVSKEVLRLLRGRLPLGIVTGRPRADAEEAMQRFGLGGLIDAVVTMEDAAPKPDPAPVRLALRKLGVERAWMVGDSRDDMLAASSAGVVPLGVLASGSDAVAGRAALFAVGCARVLDGLDELLEVLK